MVRFDRALTLLFAFLVVSAAFWRGPPPARAQSPGKLRYKGQEGQTYA